MSDNQNPWVRVKKPSFQTWMKLEDAIDAQNRGQVVILDPEYSSLDEETVSQDQTSDYDAMSRSELYSIAKARGYLGKWNKASEDVLRAWLKEAV